MGINVPFSIKIPLFMDLIPENRVQKFIGLCIKNINYRLTQPVNKV